MPGNALGDVIGDVIIQRQHHTIKPTMVVLDRAGAAFKHTPHVWWRIDGGEVCTYPYQTQIELHPLYPLR